MSKKAVVGVVEMWNEHRDRFEPTVGAGLTKDDGNDIKRLWKKKCPDDRFLVSRYVREEKP